MISINFFSTLFNTLNLFTLYKSTHMEGGGDSTSRALSNVVCCCVSWILTGGMTGYGDVLLFTSSKKTLGCHTWLAAVDPQQGDLVQVFPESGMDSQAGVGWWQP